MSNQLTTFDPTDHGTVECLPNTPSTSEQNNYWRLDLEYARDTGKLIAYVQHPANRSHRWYKAQHKSIVYYPINAIVSAYDIPLSAGPVVITNVWRSNLGDTRLSLTCKLPTGPHATLENWYGLCAGDNDIVRLTRNKYQPTVKEHTVQ